MYNIKYDRLLNFLLGFFIPFPNHEFPATSLRNNVGIHAMQGKNVGAEIWELGWTLVALICGHGLIVALGNHFIIPWLFHQDWDPHLVVQEGEKCEFLVQNAAEQNMWFEIGPHAFDYYKIVFFYVTNLAVMKYWTLMEGVSMNFEAPIHSPWHDNLIIVKTQDQFRNSFTIYWI